MLTKLSALDRSHVCQEYLLLRGYVLSTLSMIGVKANFVIMTSSVDQTLVSQSTSRSI